MKLRNIIPALLAAILTITSCTSSEYPDEKKPGAIEGKIIYEGEEEGAVAVYAYANFPPKGEPVASFVVENPEFPLAYQLENLEEYVYFIQAEMLTGANGSDLPPSGGFPEVCSIDEGVEVKEGKVKKNVDITLYDNGGSESPCYGETGDDDDDDDDNDDGNTGYLEVTIKYSGDIEPEDDIYAALFSECPPEISSIPVWIEKTKQPEFPIDWKSDPIEAGMYCLKICLDVGDYNVLCDGEGDKLKYYDDGEQTLEIEAGKTKTVIFDLDAIEL